jgi:hypothetical protein
LQAENNMPQIKEEADPRKNRDPSCWGCCSHFPSFLRAVAQALQNIPGDPREKLMVLAQMLSGGKGGDGDKGASMADLL